VTLLNDECNGGVTEQSVGHRYMSGLADNLARSFAQPAEPTQERETGVRPKVVVPYRSGFHRGVRIVGLLALLSSSLGLLASVSGLPLNPLSMLVALLLSLVLIGFTVRPSLRRPRF
jgi:hypothetical protein